jgi:LysM repeat protein
MKNVALAAIVCCIVTGCAGAHREAGEDEIGRLKGRIEMLNATLAICDAELAKDGKYVVRPGDTLGEIGKKIGLEWKELAAMNPEIMEGYPQTWNVGLVLKIRKDTPGPPAQVTR